MKNRVEELAARYQRHVLSPWPHSLAGAQRVVFVVYPEDMERALRARIGDFRQVTEAAEHGWTQTDSTSWFADWLAAEDEDYREAWFEQPELLAPKLEAEFPDYAAERLGRALAKSDENGVTALTGVGSLYGFLRVSNLVRRVEPDIRGRLVVFFPGAKDGTNYRLLNARDGWNYLAQAITLHDEG